MSEENNFLSGEQVEVSSTDATANVSDDNSQTETNVWEAIQNGETDDETVQVDDADLTDEDLDETADEQIPADEEKSEEDKPAEEKPKSRSQNYKDALAAKETLEAKLLERDTEFQGLNEKLTNLDEALESFGGVEQVSSFIENQNKFIDPSRFTEAVDYITTLPQAPAVVGEILNRSFDLGDVRLSAEQSAKALANRAEVVNSALAKDFGLTEKLSLDELSEIFEYISLRANTDKTRLLDDLRDEIEILTPEKGNEPDSETKARLAELEKQLLEQKNAQSKETKEEPLNPEKIITILDGYEGQVIDEVAAVVLKDYSKTLENLSPYQAKAIKALVRIELGAGKTFVQLADYLVGDREHANAKFLDGQYRNEVKKLVRGVALEFLGKPASSASLPPTKKQSGLTGKERGSLKPPAKKEDENPWSEFL